MNLAQITSQLPKLKEDRNVMVVLSGGLDSSIMTMVLAHHYGSDRVHAISFDYGQKQLIELDKASELCYELGISHQILNLSILGDIARPMSANIKGTGVNMPTIQDVLGDPAPSTYVPNRNMIMYSLVAAAAEVVGAEYIFCGLQVHDSYGYWDTTQAWVDAMNNILSQNRKIQIKLLAPFSHLSKYDEILIAKELEQLDLLKNTLTCYNPNEAGESCGVCPSCAERIASFKKAEIKDPISYSRIIKW